MVDVLTSERETPMIERIAASDREAWMALRGKDVTASVAGALLGVHEYMTAWQLWALKTGKLTDDPEESPAMRRGRLLEPIAVQILRETHPDWEIHHNDGPDRIYYRDTEARIGATPDVIVVDPKRGMGICQIKTIESSIFRKKWMNGDTHEAEPPLWVAVQALTEGHLCGADFVDVCLMTVGFGIDLHEIQMPKHPAIIDRLYDRTAEFWAMIDRGEEPSPDFAQDGEAIERLYARDDGSEIDLSGSDRALELVATRAGLKSMMKTAKKDLEPVETELKAMLGNHTTALLGDGRKVTWRVTDRRGYEVKATSFRVLRVSGEKE